MKLKSIFSKIISDLTMFVIPFKTSIEEFDAICERFTNKDLFLKDKNGKLIRDSSNSLIKVNYENPEG